ncbi:MAG: SIMPL domain-containing protein [Selenomonadaceae bacterium]|nr:SIMPL domain-containing protein [Selenomonadaceae bacterium]
MKIFALTLMIVMTICATTFAAEIEPPKISVSGEGFVEVTPDRAVISVGVVTRDKNSANVQAANAKAASSVINAIVALGIERKNISTGNFNFYPTRSGDRNSIDGYEATNSVTITVDDLNLVGKIIDAALSHGANQVNSLNFGLRNKKIHEDEAIKLAISDARRKAEVAASALGKTIVGVRNVSINSSYVNAPRNAKLARSMAEDSINVETPIESGTVQCAASVHVEFEIR